LLFALSKITVTTFFGVGDGRLGAAFSKVFVAFPPGEVRLNGWLIT
jgi:hypothetical protein